MRVLIVGGTSFVGRAVAFAALEKGHEVTVINRGQTPSDLPDVVTRLVGDRQGDIGFDGARDELLQHNVRPAPVFVLLVCFKELLAAVY